MSFFPHPIGFLGGALSAISLQTSVTGTSSSISAPGTVQAGDFLVLLDRATNTGGAVASAVPSGFTTITNDATATLYRMICSYRLCNGTEAGSSLFGMSGPTNSDKILLHFRGDAAISVLTLGSVNFQNSTAAPANQVITSGSVLAPVVAIAGYGAQTTVTTQGMSPTQDAQLTSSTRLYCRYKIYNLSPANVTASMGDDGTNFLQSFYLQAA